MLPNEKNSNKKFQMKKIPNEKSSKHCEKNIKFVKFSQMKKIKTFSKN